MDAIDTSEIERATSKVEALAAAERLARTFASWSVAAPSDPVSSECAAYVDPTPGKLDELIALQTDMNKMFKELLWRTENGIVTRRPV
jgi:hypothetical protein